jgi:peptidoglycan/LPS O-acetylase OafA/YrhL
MPSVPADTAPADSDTEAGEETVEEPTSDAPSLREHRAYLDGVRGVAALFVIGHHLWLQAKLPFTLYGHFAVDLFIVLSGFCLALPAAANDNRIPGGIVKYFVRRALRILPPYYLCLFFSLLIVHHWSLENVSDAALRTHLFLIHDAYKNYDLAINSPLWTIAVEWRIYLAFPFLVLLSRFWGAAPTVFICALVSEIVYRLLQGTDINTDLHGVSPHYLTLFAMGILGANIVQGREQGWARGRAGWLWWPLVAGLTYLMLSAGTAPRSEARLWDYGVGLWAASLLVLVSIPAGKIVRYLFSLRPLVWCGAFGYSLYLMHMPVIRALDQILRHNGMMPGDADPMTRFQILAGIGLPVILLVSGAFFLLCELPFRIWSQRAGRAVPPTENRAEEPVPSPRLAAPESAM